MTMESISILPHQDRRAFLKKSIAAGVGVSLVGLATNGCVKKNETQESETTPNEDLMREHGLLDRVLLIYEENLKMYGNQQDFNSKVLHSSAKIIQDFIENYHEKLEEEFLFPILSKETNMAELVITLKSQHEVGRKITSIILNQSNNPSTQDKAVLKQNISAFIFMYRAHAAREDTILFPAFKASISEQRYKELGELFEEREHKLFGKDGFEGVLAQVESLEKEMGIFRLDYYTPRI
jgi:hemerythrin-like domain-containing protein